MGKVAKTKGTAVGMKSRERCLSFSQKRGSQVAEATLLCYNLIWKLRG